MKASEARTLAEENQLTEISPILEQIKGEASNGKTTTYWYDSVNKSTINELEKLGYKVREDNSRGEYLLSIGW